MIRKKKINKITIIGNGKIDKKIIPNIDYLIAADGGALNCYKLGLTPNIIIGDMDSLPKKIRNFYIKKKVIFKIFPKDKDKTDTELAIDEAISLKPKEIFLLCLLGGRIDHQLANFFILEKIILKNIRAILLSEKYHIELINKKTILKGKIGDIISIFSLSEKSEGITLTGFQYNLNNATILRSQSLGISNILVKNSAIIKLKKGLIFIIHILEGKAC